MRPVPGRDGPDGESRKEHGVARGGRKKGSARRKKGRSGSLLVLLGVVLLIALSFFLLEMLRSKGSGKPERPVPPVERHALPPREVESPVLRSFSTPPAPVGKKDFRRGSVAIIIDDMGSSLREVNDLMAIKVPLTFAVIPGLARDREVAEEAHRKGYEVMLHLPMEPQGYPQQRLEKNGLLVSQEEDEIARRVRVLVAEVPYAAGANNHMGSRFTEHEEKMRAALGVLREKNFFFIDSRTSPKSVGYRLARSMGIEAGTRSVFLDNVQEVGAIRRQIDELAAMAGKRGSAIGIGHPHPATIRALAAALPELSREGITFVYASALAR
ncbi:divergent polysaccharide deacetylase family protein [Geobacter sp. DSM 9736]|uniref:divergent polysaccharide deacetylase family protein n=1 Tax=Geobacter sp. DSM 9736 TaxID=1277350 RepID=UPI000B508D89|nr:divergent polysaccharide deacetylase family protein [Geobacter sp. DSM 9736]SNB45293.1 hypothetical protein SAMN06269301_0700 [Geobacter sp. DSM 9736]